MAVGNSASAQPLNTSSATTSTGFLAAMRGYEEYTTSGTTTTRGPMRTLQFVWANCNAATSGDCELETAWGASHMHAEMYLMIEA